MAIDIFTGTNGDLLKNRSGWAQAFSEVEINGDRINPNSAAGGFCGAVYTGEELTDDHSSELTTTVTGFRSIGPTVRANAGTAACYFLRSRYDYNPTDLCEIASDGTISTLDAGDLENGTHTWRLDVEGNELSVYMDGSLYGDIASPVTDGTITAGQPGVGGVGTNGNTNNYGDNWEGLQIGGASPPSGSGTPSIALPTAAGSGLASHRGTGTPSTALPTAAGVGHAQPRGQGTPSIALPTAAGTGVAAHQGTGTPSAPLPTAAGTGVASHAGTGTPVAPLPTAAGTAIASHVGTGTPSTALPTADGTGRAHPRGSGTPSTAPAAAAGTGVASHVGAGTPVTPFPTATGAGIGGDEPAGSGATSIPLPTAAGVGHAQPRGQGAPSIALPTAAGSGVASHPGAGTPSTPAATAAGSGVSAHVGTGSPSIPLPTAAGSGSGGGGAASGAGSPSIAAVTASGTGVVTSVFVLILQRIALLEGSVRRLGAGRVRDETNTMDAKLNRILEMVLETQKQLRRR